MLIYQEEGYRVLQHEYLQVFYIQKWMLCDNPRTYGQDYDFANVECLTDIRKVNDWFRKNVWGEE